MAANDYYTSHSYPSNPYHDYDNRINSPLPPIPTSYSQTSFNDGTYPYSHERPSQSYSGASGRLGDDPYADNDSIPLSGRKKHDSVTTQSPILPHETEDPFVRDADPRRSKRRKGKDGWFGARATPVVYVLTLVQLIVFLVEIIKNGILTSSPIEIHPSFNPMIGPSPYVLINMGARYDPCMHHMYLSGMAEPIAANNTISWPCPNTTSIANDATNGVSCSLSELCGFGGFPQDKASVESGDPNQWWRFIVPIFLHAGIIHIGFNLLLQLTLGRDIEKLIGSVRFAVVYFAAGIFGFVLGGNFAANGIASCGCSGSLFGILAITLLDLLYTWNQRQGPIKDLLFIMVDVLIAFVLGLLPGLDNFSHIGGFLMGLVLGICILRSPPMISRRSSEYRASFVRHDRDAGIVGFVRRPVEFFQDRRGVWWGWWLVRVAALVGALVCFILLIKNFYAATPATCSWCKYLSCLPVTVSGENWCQIGTLNFTATNETTNHTKRALYDMAYSTFNPMDFL